MMLPQYAAILQIGILAVLRLMTLWSPGVALATKVSSRGFGKRNETSPVSRLGFLHKYQTFRQPAGSSHNRRRHRDHPSRSLRKSSGSIATSASPTSACALKTSPQRLPSCRRQESRCLGNHSLNHRGSRMHTSWRPTASLSNSLSTSLPADNPLQRTNNSSVQLTWVAVWRHIVSARSGPVSAVAGR